MKPKPFIPEEMEFDKNYVRNKTDQLVWHRSTYRVLYIDTDRSEVVYHSNYLRYFGYGRSSIMRATGYPYREVEQSGYIYPIIEIGIKYYNPLYYDEEMYIYTRPAEIEKVKIKFDYVVTQKDNGTIICMGFTRHCATNTSGVPLGVDEKTVYLWENFPK